MSFGAYVRAYQSMEKVASKDQSGSEVRRSITELKNSLTDGIKGALRRPPH